MKNVKLENIFVIFVMIITLLFGNFYSFVWCESDECCKTESCDENSSSDYPGLQLSVNKPDCCEYSQAVKNEIHAVSTFNTNVKSNISAPSILLHHIPDKYEVKCDVMKSTSNQFPESHSLFILRI